VSNSAAGATAVELAIFIAAARAAATRLLDDEPPMIGGWTWVERTLARQAEGGEKAGVCLKYWLGRRHIPGARVGEKTVDHRFRTRSRRALIKPGRWRDGWPYAGVRNLHEARRRY